MYNCVTKKENLDKFMGISFKKQGLFVPLIPKTLRKIWSNYAGRSKFATALEFLIHNNIENLIY